MAAPPSASIAGSARAAAAADKNPIDTARNFDNLLRSLTAIINGPGETDPTKLSLDDTLIMFMSDNGASAELLVRGDGHDDVGQKPGLDDDQHGGQRRNAADALGTRPVSFGAIYKARCVDAGPIRRIDHPAEPPRASSRTPAATRASAPI